MTCRFLMGLFVSILGAAALAQDIPEDKNTVWEVTSPDKRLVIKKSRLEKDKQAFEVLTTWDTRTGEKRAEQRFLLKQWKLGESGWVTQCQFLKDSRRFWTITGFALKDGEPSQYFNGKTELSYEQEASFMYDETGRYPIETKLQLWEATSGRLIRTFISPRPNQTLGWVQLSADERKIGALICVAVGGIAKGVGGNSAPFPFCVWDVESGRFEGQFNWHDWLNAAIFSRGNRLLLLAGGNQNPRIYEVKTGRLLRVLESDGWEAISSCHNWRFSADEKFILAVKSGGVRDDVRLKDSLVAWSVATGKSVKSQELRKLASS